MQWSVVANGRVSATPRQLLWWLLSPVTLRPLGQWLRRQPSSERGPGPKLLLVRDCTWYSLHASVPSVRPSVHPSIGAVTPCPPGFSSGIPAGGVWGSRGTGRPPRSLGALLQRSPHEGIVFISQNSLFLACRPCLTLLSPLLPSLRLVGLTRVPNTMAHCVLSQSLMSLNMPLCCARSQTLSRRILPVPVSVRVAFQKHTCLACSHPSQPFSNHSLSHLCPVLCRTLVHIPPGVWVQMRVLPARPHVSHSFRVLFLVSGVSLSLQDTLRLFTMEETGAKIYLKKMVSAVTLEESRADSFPWVLRPQGPGLWAARLPLELEQHLLGALGRAGGIVMFIKRLWNLSHEPVLKSMVPIYNPGIWPIATKEENCWELLLPTPVTHCDPPGGAGRTKQCRAEKQRLT